MSRTTRIFSKASAAALVLALMGVCAAAQAASINYGDFGPVAPGVSFLKVTESSGTDAVPLYGPPSAYATGLDFDPTGFVATSANGGADITDGQLNFTAMANANVGIGSISVFEAGDYTIAGAGNAATSVFAGAIIRGTITEINGVAVAPIDLLPVNVSFGDSLPGSVIVAPWSVGLTLNVGGALPANQLATKVEVAINNSLVATSQPGSVAFIAKKEFRIDVVPGPVIPEPTSLVLASMVLCGLGLAGRKNA
jgi:hypothetical protein